MVTASIVLYNENINVLKKTIDSFLSTPLKKKLYLIDNSLNDSIKDNFIHPEIEYISVGKNVGFGKAHNLILDTLKSEFHLILNPDVEFTGDVIYKLIKQLKSSSRIAFVTPKVIYQNGNVQNVCRKHPTVFNLINRRVKLSKKLIQQNEYLNSDLDTPFYPDFIHGCFMLFRTSCFKEIKGFDERYFLYMEDADICRKIDKLGKKKLFYPKETIVHQHQKGSSKKIKLFFYHLHSAIKYFLKWGLTNKT